MKQTIYLLIFSLITTFACAQRETSNMCNNKDFDEEVNSYLDYTIPVLSVNELKMIQDEVVLLDAREINEYEISHIKGAKHIGYNKFNSKSLENIDKNKKLVVYCSIGYRSEKIGEKLKNLGFTNVYNLYGSIFEWVNQGNSITKLDGTETRNLHTYNKKWSKWVDNPEIEKIY